MTITFNSTVLVQHSIEVPARIARNEEKLLDYLYEKGQEIEEKLGERIREIDGVSNVEIEETQAFDEDDNSLF